MNAMKKETAPSAPPYPKEREAMEVSRFEALMLDGAHKMSVDEKLRSEVAKRLS